MCRCISGSGDGDSGRISSISCSISGSGSCSISRGGSDSRDDGGESWCSSGVRGHCQLQQHHKW